MWHVDGDVLESLALGAGILGTGGGGNPYVARVWARSTMRRLGLNSFPVLDPTEVADDALVVSSGGIGAPTVSVEKLRRGDEEVRALRSLEAYLGRSAAALVPMEMGGGNAIRPLIAAAQAGIPTVDADGMGRAFPELQMVSFFMYGVRACPAGLADDKGHEVVFTAAPSARHLERLARSLTVELGGTAGMALAPMSGSELKRTGIPRTLSVARDVGVAVRHARHANSDAVEAVLEVTGGRLLLNGKISDVQRRTTTGFARGEVALIGSGPHGASLRVEFQNENLVAWSGERVVASVPDLICIVASADAEPVTTEVLRYGQRVSVLAVPCHPLLATPTALEVVGPRAFGYEVDYQPLAPNGATVWTTLM
ncbi:MAG: DUF917 domain-containing protein [Chloroflexi bacterium]|nr:DUF917 domain-containing protein [Chloroflexota bacterium]